MKKLILLLIISFVQFIFAQTPIFHDTKGELNVSNSGTLNYSIPIALPPGLNGVSPNISLSYNSGNNNGVAGFGWNISGLSAISRVNSRLDLDGKIQPIDGDDLAKDKMDAFSLDGQRLILKKNNFKTTGIIEFETEIFSNLKIEASATPFFLGHMIFSFKTISPNGSVSKYDTNGEWFGSFKIKNTTDALGNTIEYIYQKEHISEIKWGRNTNTTTAGVDNAIKFIYKTRDRIEYSDLLNTPKIADKILDRIEVYTQGKLFRKFVLTHQTIQNNYQRLTQVQEFNATNEGANPVVFSYNDTPNTISNMGYFKSSTGNAFANIQLSGDFDGNGESDFIANNQLYLNAIGNNNTWTPISFPAGFDAKYNVASVKALQPDGRIFQNQAIAKFKGNTLELYDKEKLVYTKTFNFDMRADGPADEYTLVDYSGGGCEYYGTLANAYRQLEQMKADKTNADYGMVYEGDFNGDGLSEIIYRRTAGGGIYLYGYKKRKGFWPFYSWEYACGSEPPPGGLRSGPGKEYTYLLDIRPTAFEQTPNFKQIDNLPFRPNNYIFDMNGDGKDDFITIDYKKELKAYNFSLDEPGSTVVPSIINSGTTIDEFDKNKQMVWGDFNGDGKVELMIPERENSANWFIYSYTPISLTKTTYPNFIPYEPLFIGAPSKNQIDIKQYQASDMDKDGKSDFLVIQNRSICVNVASDGTCDRDGTSRISIYNNMGGQKSTEYNNPYFPKFNLNPVSFEVSNDTPYGATYSFTGDFRSNRFSDASNIVFIEGSQIWKLKYNKNLGQDLTISKVSEMGGGIQTEVTYTPMTPSTANNGYGNQNDFYYSAHDEKYPNAVVRETPSSKLVSQLKITGAGQTKKQNFKYYGLTVNSHGYGYFGFKKMARSSFFTDAQPARIWSVTETKPGFLGKAVKEWTYKTDDHNLFHTSPTNATTNPNLLSLTEYSYNNGVELPTPKINQKTIKKITLTKSTKKDFLTNVVNTSTIEYDAFLNPTKSVTTNGLSTKTTNLLYFNNPAGVDKNYILGRLLQKNESVTAYNDTRTTEEKFVYTNNLPTKKQTKAHNTDYITEDNLYDAFGNLTQKTVSAPGVSARTSKYEYDATKRFVVKETDPDNFVTQYEYNTFGQPTKETDNNLGILSQNIYDNWGKPIQNMVTGSSATPVIENLAYVKNTNGTYTITNSNPATGEESSKQLDAFGREIKVTTKGFAAGTKISKATEYDFLGRKTRESEAYFDNATPAKWNIIAYDDLSRPTQQTLFTGKKITIGYNGLTTTTNDGSKTIVTTIWMPTEIPFL